MARCAALVAEFHWQLTSPMTALTIRVPDDKYERLKVLSKRRGTRVNRLIDELATQLLTEFDSEERFQLRAERGRGEAGTRGRTAAQGQRCVVGSA